MSTFGIGPISIAGLVSTSDDVTLTMKLTALDPSKFTIPTAIAAPAVGAAAARTARRSRTSIMPALQANCASCHNPGQVGAAHWTLDTAADAAKISDGIGSVVERAVHAAVAGVDRTACRSLHSKRLDQTTIDAIVKWSDAGGPLDVPGVDARSRPTGGPPVPPPRHDVVLQMPQAYAGSLSVPNDYRCFVLDPHITKPTYMTGYEVTPDHRAEIHHVADLPHRPVAGRGRAQDLRAATASPAGAATARSSCRRRERHAPAAARRSRASPARPASSPAGCRARTRSSTPSTRAS